MSTYSHRLSRMYELYRRRIGRYRTENQLNKFHIALENYLTPAEARHLGIAVSWEPLDSPSRPWAARLEGFFPIGAERAVEFERRTLLKGATWYRADAVPTAQKTLIVGFAGHFNRLMLPMPWMLDCLNPAHYDVLVLRDFARLGFVRGIPGLGETFSELLANLARQVRPDAYRNTVGLGTSGGGIPAVLMSIALRLDRGISICGQDFGRFSTKLASVGYDAAPYAALLASRPQRFPEILLVYGAKHAEDAAAAQALAKLVPSRLAEIDECAEHTVLAWALSRGKLPELLSTVLGQSVETGAAEAGHGQRR